MQSDPDRVDTKASMLLYAFRYALGRQSYCVLDVADELIALRDALTGDWRRQIVQDIDVAIAEGQAGAAADVERWRRVRAAMV